MNKWKNGAIPALLLHCSIGTVYCWSIFSQEIATSIGFSKSAIEWAFSIAIFFLGMSAAFAGKFVERDIQKASKLSTVFFFCGLFCTSMAIRYGIQHTGSLIALIGIYLGYGVIMGIGLGLGYLSPVKTLMLWFKDHKGLATGLAVAGFGAAKAIASPIMQKLLTVMSLDWMFLTMAIVYFIMMYTGHLLLRKPQDWHEEIPDKNAAKKTFSELIQECPSKFNYFAIWIIFFLNITAGLAVISQEKQFLISMNRLDLVANVAAVSAIFNALGRVCFATLSDKLTRKKVVFWVIFATSSALTVLARIFSTDASYILAMIFMVNAGYGGGFSCIPVLLQSFYGMKNISTLHGITLSAWAFAGLAGNQLATITHNYTGSYNALYTILSGMYLVSLILCFCLKGDRKE